MTPFAASDNLVARYHVTTLSNFVIAYKKYDGVYDKSLIPNNRFPNHFYLLEEDDITIGVEKTKGLLAKLSIENDQMILIETHLPARILNKNLRNGIGEYIEGTTIPVAAVYLFDDTQRIPVCIEITMALGLALDIKSWHSFEALIPRSVSILPVANGCQARCAFCFSDSSISKDAHQQHVDTQRWDQLLLSAKTRGAIRAIITGGGEPGLLAKTKLLDLIKQCRRIYPKVVLISNGYMIATAEDTAQYLRELVHAGLSVLAISRHHYCDATNQRIMSLDTGFPKIIDAFNLYPAISESLQLRSVCVLQKGGIETQRDLARYLDYCATSNITSICFKELYVSTSIESTYYQEHSNAWSKRNQVPLSMVTRLFEHLGWRVKDTLPWGSPVYEGHWNGVAMTVAAYTEPSVSWERRTGLCRSWNILADGRCFASLETPQSEVCPQHELC